MSSPPVMSVGEVADLLGISREYVRRLLPAHGITPVRGYPTDPVLALHASRQEATMTITAAHRNAQLDEAREIAATLPDGAPIGVVFADHLIDGIHAAFPHLQTLAALVSMAASRDQARYLEGVPDGEVTDFLGGYSDSTETSLARQAYEMALRAVVFGHRYES